MGAALGGGLRRIEVEGVRDNRQNVADLRTVTYSPVRRTFSADKIHGPEVEIFRALGSSPFFSFNYQKGAMLRLFKKNINCCLNELDRTYFCIGSYQNWAAQ